MTTIEGDISLLCYFPFSKKLKGGKENDLPTEWIESSVLLKPKEKVNFCEKDVSDAVDSDATSDFLLARALDEIDNERENIYERPRGGGEIMELLKEK